MSQVRGSLGTCGFEVHTELSGADVARTSSANVSVSYPINSNKKHD